MANSKKEQGGMSLLFALASGHKGLLAVSGLLAALAAIASFVPYLAVYWIVRDVIAVYPDFSVLQVGIVVGCGGIAIAGIAADALCFLVSSICAHIAAFGTQYELKTAFTRHLAKVPLGFHLTIGSGRLRKVIDEE